MYLMIVTGLSGAGKSQVLRKLEDLGYFCVDNLPAGMLEGFVGLCSKASPPVERAAVVIDSRESIFKSDFFTTFKTLDVLDVSYGILFLECTDDVLERRYNETRRRHPISDEIREGIARERDILTPLRNMANYVIDTSELKPLDLSQRLDTILSDGQKDNFVLVFESFGYKRGIPIEADIVFDVRFSKNPFYEPQLKNLSGRDKPVRDYVLSDENFVFMLDELEKMLLRIVPGYMEQGKRRLMVAFGCTGGRHRSVCAAEEMDRRMKEHYVTKLVHRDTVVEADDIRKRCHI